MVKVSRRTPGFTIVELLIVIIVIAILAAIVIVAYNGVQASAQDSRTRNAAQQLETAIRTWGLNTGQRPLGGWSSTVAVNASGNCSDGTGGWIFAGAYTCSLEDMLRSQNLIPANFTRSSFTPNTAYSSSVKDGSQSVMFYPCGTNTGKYGLFWYVANQTADDAASLTSVESQGCPSGPRTTYMMRAARLIDFN